MQDSIESLFEDARRLTRAGDDDAAKTAYLELLRQDPAHFGALTNLAALALASGHRQAALTAYRQAMHAHPSNPAGHVNLANLLLADGDEAGAKAHYRRALALDTDFAPAHLGLARLLFAAGETEAAKGHESHGLAHNPLVSIPYRGSGRPVRVLMLVSARGGNIPTELLLSDRIFAVSALYVEGYRPDQPLPPHDFVFNAIGDADLCGDALAMADAILRETDAPILNRPSAVLRSTRESNAARLAEFAGVVVPRTSRFPCDFFAGANAAELLEREGFRFPILLRAPGFHTGQHFVRVERPSDLANAAAELPGGELLAIEYLDARGRDGRARKYRAMIVGGALYPLHLAASHSWKIHYFTSVMAEHAELREEEAAFLRNMPGVLGPRAMTALEAIARALALDYGGIDFGLTPKGDVLFFEANATMVIVPPNADAIWDYRRPAIARVLDAAQQMLLRHYATRDVPWMQPK